MNIGCRLWFKVNDDIKRTVWLTLKSMVAKSVKKTIYDATEKLTVADIVPFLTKQSMEDLE